MPRLIRFIFSNIAGLSRALNLLFYLKERRIPPLLPFFPLNFCFFVFYFALIKHNFTLIHFILIHMDRMFFFFELTNKYTDDSSK